MGIRYHFNFHTIMLDSLFTMNDLLMVNMVLESHNLHFKRYFYFMCNNLNLDLTVTFLVN